MIFDVSDHFVSFLRNEISTAPFTESKSSVVSFKQDAAKYPIRMMLVIFNPGAIQYFPPKRIVAVQIICQDSDNAKAYGLAMTVLSCLQERYDFDLPIPDGKTDPAIRVAQMRPTTDALPIGDVGNGRFQWSLNFNLTLEV